MQIKEGKRYERADGLITGELCSNKRTARFPFWDPKFKKLYTSEGRYLECNRSPNDLIGEWRQVSAKPSFSTLTPSTLFEKVFWS